MVHILHQPSSQMAIPQSSTSVALFVILLYVIAAVSAFTPVAVMSPVAAVLDDGLVYFYGGTTMSPNASAGATTQFIAINVSCSWNTLAPAYVDLNSAIPSGSPPMYKAAIVDVAGKLVIALGFTIPTAPPFIAYTPGSNLEWAPILPNNSLTNNLMYGPQITDAGMAAIPSGLIYIWGGMTLNGPMSTFWVVDAIKYSWHNITLHNNATSPPLMLGHVIVATNDKRLCPIGGITQKNGAGVRMSEIWCFDTVAGQWNSTIATPTIGGTLPEPRINHTAILDGNGNIVMYGGMACSQTPPTVCSFPPLIKLAILDITSFLWITPSLDNEPSAMYGHSAVIVNNQMIVAFGAQIATPTTPSNDVYILDMYNGSYSWVTQFNSLLSPVIPSNDVSSSTNNPSVSVIVGAVFGVSLLSLVVALAVWYIWRRKKLSDMKLNEHLSPKIEHRPFENDYFYSKPNEPTEASNEYAEDVRKRSVIESFNAKQYYKPDSRLSNKATDSFSHRTLFTQQFTDNNLQMNDYDILMNKLHTRATMY